MNALFVLIKLYNFLLCIHCQDLEYCHAKIRAARDEQLVILQFHALLITGACFRLLRILFLVMLVVSNFNSSKQFENAVITALRQSIEYV